MGHERKGDLKKKYTYNTMGEKTALILISIFVAISAIALFVVNKPKEILKPTPVVVSPEHTTKDDQTLVEAYLRTNIKTLAPEQPVLGGSWYVVSVTLNQEQKSGVVVYEDGHIQGKASFSYTIEGENVVLNNIKKTK